MRSIRITTTLFSLGLLPATAATVAPFGERVDKAMRNEMAGQELIGLAVGIIQDGQIAYL